jgi:hypothetical protein
VFFESLPPALLIPFSVTRFRTLLSVVGDVSLNRSSRSAFIKRRPTRAEFYSRRMQTNLVPFTFLTDLAVAFTTILSSHPITLQ